MFTAGQRADRSIRRGRWTSSRRLGVDSRPRLSALGRRRPRPNVGHQAGVQRDRPRRPTRPPAGRRSTRSCATPGPAVWAWWLDLVPAAAALGVGQGRASSGPPTRMAPQRRRVRAVRGGRGHPLQRSLHPSGVGRAATPGQPLVDLERAQPRASSWPPRSSDHTQIEQSRPAVSGLRRRRLEGPARHRPRIGHDPDRRDRPGRGHLSGVGPGPVRLRCRRCASCAPCTASTPPSGRCRARRRRRAAARPPPRPAGTFAAQNPGLFHASGFADHPYPQGLAPNQALPTSPTTPSWPRCRKLERTLDHATAGLRLGHQVPDLVDRVRLSDHAPRSGGGDRDPGEGGLYLNWSEYLTWLNPRHPLV